MSPRPDLIVLAGGRGSRLGGALKPAVEVAGRTLLSRVLDARPLARHAVVVAPPEARAAATFRTEVGHASPTGDSTAEASALIWALEDPPFGGPVAGIAAGLAALETHLQEPGDEPGDGPAAWLLVLACDLPWGADAARLLVAAASALDLVSLTAPSDAAPPATTSVDTTPSTPLALHAPEAGRAQGVDGVHLVDTNGRAQWLAGIYRAPALRSAVVRLGDRVDGASMRQLLDGLNLEGLHDESGAGIDVDTWQDVERSSARLTDHSTEE